MSDFETARAALRKTQAEFESAREASLRASQSRIRLQAKGERLNRSVSKSSTFVAKAQAHASLASGAENRARTDSARLDVKRKELEQARIQWERFTDPRNAITQMSDDAPFLLFPVRLETRFRPIDGSRDFELCVRVFPDDCSIDSFEPVPSDAELDAMKRYWIAEWQSGGIVEPRRQAWRSLVTTLGAGRSEWLRSAYAPLNVAAMPTKSDPAETVLVIVVHSEPAPGDVAAIQAYWRELWVADGDAAATSAARSRLPAALRGRIAEIDANPPVNFSSGPPAPLTRKNARVSASFLVLKSPAEIDVQKEAWSRPPRAVAWPDRFVLILYPGGHAEPHIELGNLIPQPLLTGIDPMATAIEQIRHDPNGDLVVPPSIKWMTDFDEAKKIGMAFAVRLSPPIPTYERIVVIGVRAQTDAAAGADELATLIASHRNGARGFAIVPQGTPTNNTESAESGYSRLEDSRESFDRVVLQNNTAAPVRAKEKSDGQLLAQWLGIPASAGQDLPDGRGFDQAESRAMNIALWDGSLGYWMGTLMHPVFSEDAIARTRDFFCEYVSGRGPVPAIRIGDQPYGILPVTAFSRMQWMKSLAPDGLGGMSESEHLVGLASLLEKVASDWRQLANAVPRVGGPGDPAQNLLKVMGLHATSVSYAQRWVEGFATAYNRLAIAGAVNVMKTAALSELTHQAWDLLRNFGYAGREEPELLKQFHFTQHIDLNGPVVDIVPLSEADALGKVAGSKNYIEWLATAARTSVNAVRDELGFDAPGKPRALLYLLLRYAILEGYFNASLRARETGGAVQRSAVGDLRKVTQIMHVAQSASAASRFEMLTSTDRGITGNSSERVSDFLTRELGKRPATDTLKQQLEALDRLSKVPTARLERLLAEHIDCCNYRLDAWRTGLVHRQLAHMRRPAKGNLTPRTGVLLGAYGWLLNVGRRDRKLTPVTLGDAGLRQSFGERAPMRDSSNGGYILAPSQNQAVAAAILRAGYVANASPTNRETCSVFLSSQRVRSALATQDGVRAGMSGSAILSRQFERGLHDRQADRLKYFFRNAFPLEPMASGAQSDALDGERLAMHLRQHAASQRQLTYPFGLSLPGGLTSAEQNAVNTEAKRLLETLDAMSDLDVAEGTYQAVNGNWTRVKATMDSAAGLNIPAEPDVIRTPAQGFQLTHRVALHFDASVSPTASPVPGVGPTPMSLADPALNDWLSATLPSLTSIACRVTYRSATGAEVDRDVTLADLGFQPIDVLDVLAEQRGKSFGGQALEDRIVWHLYSSAQRPEADAIVRARDGAADERAISISYLSTRSAPVTMARASALVRALRGLLSSARPLRPSHLAPPGTAAESPDIDAHPYIDQVRVEALRSRLKALQDRLDRLIADLAPDVHKGTKNAAALSSRNALVQRADQTLDASYSLLLDAARFKLNSAGVSFLHDWRRKLAGWARSEADSVVARWQKSLSQYSNLLLDYARATEVAEKFQLLERAERCISTVATVRPATPTAMRAAVDRKRALFETRLAGFRNYAGAIPATIAEQRNKLTALLPVSQFDFTWPDPIAFDEIVRLMSDEVADAAKGIRAEIAQRLTDAGKVLAELTNINGDAEKENLQRKAARILLSDEVFLIPEISIGEDHSAELSNAVSASNAGTLLEYLKSVEKVAFPMDEWLYGCARVREPLRRLEQVIMFTGPLGVAEPELTPIQFPFKQNDSWLAMRYPPAYSIEGEKLLYAACWRRAFATGQRLCGLLLDEWSEVIPARDAKCGMVFHCDVPSSEAQQVWALVTPTAFRGHWEWRDLLDGVNEMIDVAKLRLVEPSQIDATPYAPFLPAIATAASRSVDAIEASITRNNMKSAAAP